jgi:hypothetical protein
MTICDFRIQDGLGSCNGFSPPRFSFDERLTTERADNYSYFNDEELSARENMLSKPVSAFRLPNSFQSRSIQPSHRRECLLQH